MAIYDENQCVQSALKGDSKAFENLVERYQSLVCAITFSGTGEVHISEELAQETFLRAWQRLSQLKSPDSFKSWLCSIAKNLINNYHRTQHVRGQIRHLDEAEKSEVISSSSHEPVENLIRKEEAMLVQDIIMRIPEIYREILVLHYREQYSVQELAVKLDINESTASVRLHRGREMIREELAGVVERTISSTRPGKAFTTAVMAGIAGIGVGVSGTATAAGTGAAIGAGTGTAIFAGLTAKLVTAAAVVIAVGATATVAYKHFAASSSAADISTASVKVQNDANEQKTPAQDVNTNVQTAALAGAALKESSSLPSNKAIAKNIVAGSIKTVDPNLAEPGFKAVVKDPNGNPVQDVNIGVRIYYGKQPKGTNRSYFSDANGTAFVPLAAVPMNLTITASKAGFSPVQISWSPGRDHIEIPTTVTLCVEKGTSIGGYIKDPNSNPIAGVKVWLLVPDNSVSGQQRTAIWDYRVDTDANGFWRFDLAPSKMEEVWIRLAHPDFISDSMYGETAKFNIAELRSLSAVAVMKRGYSLSGHIWDQNTPVVKASVMLGRDRWGTHLPVARTDANGFYKFSNLKPGQTYITVQVKGLAPELKPFNLEEPNSRQDFHLQTGKTISGIVVDANEQPIAGASISADTWRGIRTINLNAKTKSDGRFSIINAPDDEILFSVMKEKFGYIRDYAMSPSETEYRITLSSELRVKGTVTDALTGKPIASFKFIRGTKFENDDSVYWNLSGALPLSNGTFDTVYGEPDRSHCIKIEAKGYNPAVSRLFKNSEGTVTLDFKLTPASDITGTVLTASGAKVKGAKVILYTYSTPAQIENGVLLTRRENVVVETDSNGVFWISPQEGNFGLFISHDSGYAKISSSELTLSQAIMLRPWSVVEGTYKIGSKPAVNALLRLDYNFSDDQRDSNVPRVWITGKAVTDEEGRFRFERVVQGVGTISREEAGGAGPVTTMYTNSTHVEIQQGQTTVNIGGNGRPVVGKLLPPSENQDFSFQNAMNHMSVKDDFKYPLPADYNNYTQEQKSAWFRNFSRSPEYQEHANKRRQWPNFGIAVKSDGSFRIDDVPAGTYQMNFGFYKPGNNRQSMPFGEVAALLNHEVTVPEIKPEQIDEPLDIGTIQLEKYDPNNVKKADQ